MSRRSSQLERRAPDLREALQIEGETRAVTRPARQRGQQSRPLPGTPLRRTACAAASVADDLVTAEIVGCVNDHVSEVRFKIKHF
jgi:hypothetical protein